MLCINTRLYGSDRPDRSDWSNWPDRSNWPDWSDRSKRSDWPDWSDWSDRPDRPDRPNRTGGRCCDNPCRHSDNRGAEHRSCSNEQRYGEGCGI